MNLSSIVRFSPSAHVTSATLRLLRHKNTQATAERVQRDVASRTLRPERFAPPRRLDRTVDIIAGARHDWRCYQLSPRDEPAVEVLYLHGGAYIMEIGPLQWTAVAKLAVETPARVTVPIFPVAPHSTAATTVATATDIAADLLAEHGADNVAIMGDSAGGGMALAVAQQLRDQHQVQPRRIVLISPWLDVTMSNPAIDDIDHHDAMLGAPGLAEAGRIYAGDLDPSDPRVSPMHGDLTGLAPITMYSGTYDILNADSHDFVIRAEASGVDLDYQELVGGHHCYPFYPTRHGRAARRHIAQSLAET